MSDSQQQQQQPVIDPIAALAAVTAAEQSTDATPATALEEPEPEGYNGDLPEFSDSEDTPPPATSSKVPVARPKSGPPGKGKKVPLAALKKKLAGGAAAVSASVASSSSSSSSKDKQKAKAVEDDNGAVAATEQKLKGMKLSDSQLDAVIAQLVKNQPHLEGKVSRADAQAFINSTGMNKKVLEGKEGLFGKTVSDMGSHKFWSTQPVTKFGTPLEELREGPLEPNKPASEVRQEPIDLHKDFKWVSVNLEEEVERKEVYDLLTHNYVEDPDASFRFDYSSEFLDWALRPPGYIADWHVGIRVATTNKLVGFISGIPMDIRVRAVTKRCTEINFLCVHKKLRSKRLAPLLIQEVTRRTHLRGVFQAIYTGGAYLPTPVARCQYFHRNLNPAKLVKTGFSSVPRNSTIARMINHYKTSAEPTIPGLRELEKGDLKQASRLLRAYEARFDIAPAMSNKEIEHALFAGRGKMVDGKRVGQVVWTYVVEDPVTHRVTDLFSFYSLPSTATKVTPKTLINAAYLFYYASTSCPSCSDLGDGSVATPVTNWRDETEEERKVLKERLTALIGDALSITSKLGFDVLNALTIQDNALFLEDLKFGRGDGYLHYYLYNYSTKPILGGIDPTDGGSGVGVVML